MKKQSKIFGWIRRVVTGCDCGHWFHRKKVKPFVMVYVKRRSEPIPKDK